MTPAAPTMPLYQVGETATTEVISPVHMIVIDHRRTEKLRREEAQRVPAIFRFYPDTINEAEASLQEAFTAAREKFMDVLERNYAKRTLNEAAVTSPRFQRLVTSFQNQSRPFPVSTNLAQIWALGVSDESVQTNLIAALREMMEHPIHTDPLPREGKIGPRQIKMIAVSPKEVALDLPLVETQATNFWRTNIYSLSKARKDLEGSFPPEERAMRSFLAGFLQENCAFDQELTRQSRTKRTEAIWAADEYEPGQSIVKPGDVIDTRLKAVLDQLQERAAGEQAIKDVAKDRREAQTAFAELHQQTARAETVAQITSEQRHWLWAGIVGLSMAFCFMLWRQRHWNSSQLLLPTRVRPAEISGTVVSCPACTGTIVLPLELTGSASSPAPATQPASAGSITPPAEADAQYWKERALIAEGRVQKTNYVLRAALIPHLARWLMSKLVRGLASQRADLLETQQKAEQEMANLEQRLASVQAPLEDRLKAYEQRIAELEKDLTAKGEENRDIIKATIAMAKKKLELERSKEAKERLAWN